MYLFTYLFIFVAWEPSKKAVSRFGYSWGRPFFCPVCGHFFFWSLFFSVSQHKSRTVPSILWWWGLWLCGGLDQGVVLFCFPMRMGGRMGELLLFIGLERTAAVTYSVLLKGFRVQSYRLWYCFCGYLFILLPEIQMLWFSWWKQPWWYMCEWAHYVCASCIPLRKCRSSCEKTAGVDCDVTGL